MVRVPRPTIKNSWHSAQMPASCALGGKDAHGRPQDALQRRLLDCGRRFTLARHQHSALGARKLEPYVLDKQGEAGAHRVEGARKVVLHIQLRVARQAQAVARGERSALCRAGSIGVPGGVCSPCKPKGQTGQSPLALYTAVMSYFASSDLLNTDDRKTPGTVFEIIVAHIVAAKLGTLPVKHTTTHTMDGPLTIPTDYIF